MKIEIADLIAENIGELPYVSKIGAYPLFYVAKGEVICPTCANEIIKGTANYDIEADDIEEVAVNWEDTELYCKNGHKIDCATVDVDVVEE